MGRAFLRFWMPGLLACSLAGNAYWGYEFHRLAGRFDALCCDPYADMGCVNVEEYVCEPEPTWSKILDDCTETDHAYAEERKLLAVCEARVKRQSKNLNQALLMAAPCKRPLGDATAEVAAWNAELLKWMTLVDRRNAMLDCLDMSGRKVP